MNSIASLESQANRLPQMDSDDIVELANRVNANIARLVELQQRIAAEQNLRANVQAEAERLWRSA